MEFGRVPIKLVNKSYLCSAGNLRAITVCLDVVVVEEDGWMEEMGGWHAAKLL